MPDDTLLGGYLTAPDGRLLVKELPSWAREGAEPSAPPRRVYSSTGTAWVWDDSPLAWWSDLEGNPLPHLTPGMLDFLRSGRRARSDFQTVERGGPGSGHWGHRGRPGHVGGSLPTEGGPRHASPSSRRPRSAEGGAARPRRPSGHPALRGFSDDTEKAPEAVRAAIEASRRRHPRSRPFYNAETNRIFFDGASGAIAAARQMTAELQRKGQFAGPALWYYHDYEMGSTALPCIALGLDDWLDLTRNAFGERPQEYSMVLTSVGPIVAGRGGFGHTPLSVTRGDEVSVGTNRRDFYRAIDLLNDLAEDGLLDKPFLAVVHNHPPDDDDRSTPSAPPSPSDVRNTLAHVSGMGVSRIHPTVRFGTVVLADDGVHEFWADCTPDVIEMADRVNQFVDVADAMLRERISDDPREVTQVGLNRAIASVWQDATRQVAGFEYRFRPARDAGPRVAVGPSERQPTRMLWRARMRLRPSEDDQEVLIDDSLVAMYYDLDGKPLPQLTPEVRARLEALERERQRWRDSHLVERGGEGSGHWGHKGRPGHRGGSLPGKGGGSEREHRLSRAAFEARFGEYMDEAMRRYGVERVYFDEETGRVYVQGKKKDAEARRAERTAANWLAHILQENRQFAGPIEYGGRVIVALDADDYLEVWRRNHVESRVEYLTVVGPLGPVLLQANTPAAAEMTFQRRGGSTSVKYPASVVAAAVRQAVPVYREAGDGGTIRVVHNHPSNDADPDTLEGPPSPQDVYNMLGDAGRAAMQLPEGVRARVATVVTTDDGVHEVSVEVVGQGVEDIKDRATRFRRECAAAMSEVLPGGEYVSAQSVHAGLMQLWERTTAAVPGFRYSVTWRRPRQETSRAFLSPVIRLVRRVSPAGDARGDAIDDSLVAMYYDLDGKPLPQLTPEVRARLEALERERQRWRDSHLVERGGEGSGHWGHEGRPGRRGGSLPGKGRAAEHKQEGQAAREARLMAEAHEHAGRLLAAAKAAEPGVTRTLTALAERLGAHMAGLEHRLKSGERLAEKIVNEAEQNGLSLAEQAEEITDALRYTMAWANPDEYVPGVLAAIEALKDAGYRVYDARLRNYWAPGDPYDGYNTVWVTPGGQRVELQFHTDDSLGLKEQSHRVYQRFRALEESDPEREHLAEQMASLWTRHARPPGWERLPGGRMDQVGGGA